MIKVLFVCLGNICRSPVAEAVFKKRIIEHGLEHMFEADSAGTSAYHLGEPPDRRSVLNANLNGVTVSHLARQFVKDDFEQFQYILAMDYQNLSNIEAMAKAENIQHPGVFLLRSFQPDPDWNEVPDPYFGGEPGFQNVFNIIDDSTINFIKYLKSKL